MRKLLLLLGPLFVASLSLAQTTTWSINISPNISYRIAPVPAATPRAGAVQSGERAMHTFDFGLDIRTELDGRFTVGSGLFYSQKGFSNVYVAAPYDRPTLDDAYRIDFMQDYLDIPVFMTYTLAQHDKFRWYALAGINNSLLLREKNDVAVRGAEASLRETPSATRALLSEPYLKATRGYSLGAMGGFGVRAQMDAKTFIGLETVSKLMFTPLQDQASDSQRRQYSLGLNFRFIRTLR